MIPPLKKIDLGNQAVNKLQENVRILTNEIIGKQILDGILLTKVSLTTGVTNPVDHKLGRQPLGWLVLRKRATADIWDTQDTNTNNKNGTLFLRCSADVVVDLWIF